MATHPRHKTTVEPPTLGSDYIHLGIDERGVAHVADQKNTSWPTVHAVRPDGSRKRRWLDAGSLDDYMDAVADAHGWQRRAYGVSLAEMLVEAVEVE